MSYEAELERTAERAMADADTMRAIRDSRVTYVGYEFDGLQLYQPEGSEK